MFIQPVERNPQFINPLVNAASPYLRRHAHNPVFWHPWGREALDRAREEDKPILLSIGYSTCYWCHVMEREVFENLSIASLMNRWFVNIKVDREEHPEIDDIYMIARQVMTHEGGWPNNVFLTPDLKPFYAGGTYGPEPMYGKPSFTQLLEWLHYAWTTQRQDIHDNAQSVAQAMQPFLAHQPPSEPPALSIRKQAGALFDTLRKHYDDRAGGFFQHPKFPHEVYLQFLLAYYRHTRSVKALDMVGHSLSKMAAGGIYDHVSSGFHRYAVDREWHIPHFEKMLYSQAMLARVCAEASELLDYPYLATVAQSVLDFTAGPLTDGNGAFYTGIDAQTDGAEGAYYAWTPQELQALLTEEELHFFADFYALADIPAFAGHKHAEGQVIVARQPLGYAAKERGMPYVQLSALSGQVMNKLLAARNRRQAPRLDAKIITGWNGLMIEALAYASGVFKEPRYLRIAGRAADFILEHAIDNNGSLQRIHVGGRAQLAATLEDYAYLIHGLLALYRAGSGKEMLESAVSLAEQTRTRFWDHQAGGGYFFAESSDVLPWRIKSGDDSALPSPNAIMLHNLLDLFAATAEEKYLAQARALSQYFLAGMQPGMVENATMLAAMLRLDMLSPAPEESGSAIEPDASVERQNRCVALSAALFPADSKPGALCEALVFIEIADGWHLPVSNLSLDVRGGETLAVLWPDPIKLRVEERDDTITAYAGLVSVTVRMKLKENEKNREPVTVLLRYQACSQSACMEIMDEAISIS